MSLKQAAILAVLAAAVGVAGYLLFGGSDEAGGSGPPIVAVNVPVTLSARAQIGQKTYEASCAACHACCPARRLDADQRHKRLIAFDQEGSEPGA
ncbi:MAG: hypothetical protein F4Y03_13035 [Alphaproteobacteria bacterium]|nr:hypothetical protein [Alphaproteobacteria bacterium]